MRLCSLSRVKQRELEGLDMCSIFTGFGKTLNDTNITVFGYLINCKILLVKMYFLVTYKVCSTGKFYLKTLYNIFQEELSFLKLPVPWAGGESVVVSCCNLQTLFIQLFTYFIYFIFTLSQLTKLRPSNCQNGTPKNITAVPVQLKLHYNVTENCNNERMQILLSKRPQHASVTTSKRITQAVDYTYTIKENGENSLEHASLALTLCIFLELLPVFVVWTFFAKFTTSSFLSSISFTLVSPNICAASNRQTEGFEYTVQLPLASSHSQVSGKKRWSY